MADAFPLAWLWQTHREISSSPHALADAFTSFMLFDAYGIILSSPPKKMYLERSDGILLAVNATRRE